MKKYTSVIIAGLLPFMMHAQLVMTNNSYIVLNGGNITTPAELVLSSSVPSGITTSGKSWIISENEFNIVQWSIGANIGNYVVPFGYSNTEYIPVTYDVSSPGSGNGVVKFSTYHGISWQNSAYEPSDVTNCNIEMAYKGSPFDDSKHMVDRFWDIDLNTGYTTKPEADLTFTYIRNGITNEIAKPNEIHERSLIAVDFNTVKSIWDTVGTRFTDVISGSTGTISTGMVTSANLFRSWTLAGDSTILLGVPTTEVAYTGGLITWPNPANQTINVKFGDGQQGDAVISIVNLIGQELMRQEKYVSTGMILPIDISSLPTAMYFVRVSTNTFVATSKFVKEN